MSIIFLIYSLIDMKSRKWPSHEVSLAVEQVSALNADQFGREIKLPRKTELSRKEVCVCAVCAVWLC